MRAKRALREMMYAETREQADEYIDRFISDSAWRSNAGDESNGAEELPLVRAGVTFVDGIQQERDKNEGEDRKDAA